jgi:uroporphyrinogen decarboxylase
MSQSVTTSNRSAPLSAAPHTQSLAGSTFLAAARGETPTRTPVWFMRQAGRSLPEYRALRKDHTFEEMINAPELAAEVTLQPVRRHGVDAAVLFSDIITPAQAVLPDVTIEAGRGPVIPNPIRSRSQLDDLRAYDPVKHTPFVGEAVERICAELSPQGVPVIGFAGAPFTVATYLVEGGKSKEFATTKTMMHAEPELWRDLLDVLADMAIASLRSQVLAGASAVQLFDSWAGVLSDHDYRTHVLPASTKVFTALADLQIPRAHFGVGTGELLGAMADAGADMVGVDWRVPLHEARRRVGPAKALQGNLDPTLLLAPWPVVESGARQVLRDAAKAGGGYVFNLGHGVLPETEPEVLTRLVALVHGA